MYLNLNTNAYLKYMHKTLTAFLCKNVQVWHSDLALLLFSHQAVLDTLWLLTAACRASPGLHYLLRVCWYWCPLSPWCAPTISLCRPFSCSRGLSFYIRVFCQWVGSSHHEKIHRTNTEEIHKKGLNDQNNHDGVVTHLEPDILIVKSSGP